MKVTPPEVPTPGMEGGVNEKAMPSSTFAKLLDDVAADGSVLFVRSLSLVPRFFSNKEESAVSGLHAAQQAEADDRGAALHTGRLQNDFFDLAGGVAGALQRSRIGKLQCDKDVALVFFGQEGGRQTRRR